MRTITVSEMSGEQLALFSAFLDKADHVLIQEYNSLCNEAIVSGVDTRASRREIYNQLLGMAEELDHRLGLDPAGAPEESSTTPFWGWVCDHLDYVEEENP